MLVGKNIIISRIMKKIILVLLFLFVINAFNYSYAQTEPNALNEQLDSLLTTFQETKSTLKKQRDKDSKKSYREVRQIGRNIIKALNSVPPEKCLKVLNNAMQDLYSLVSELSTGISCGPNISPPFLPGADELSMHEEENVVEPDCILPPEEEFQTTPYTGPFSVVNPLYDEAIDLFRTDSDENNMPDVCESVGE